MTLGKRRCCFAGSAACQASWCSKVICAKGPFWKQHISLQLATTDAAWSSNLKCTFPLGVLGHDPITFPFLELCRNRDSLQSLQPLVLYKWEELWVNKKCWFAHLVHINMCSKKPQVFSDGLESTCWAGFIPPWLSDWFGNFYFSCDFQAAMWKHSIYLKMQ